MYVCITLLLTIITLCLAVPLVDLAFAISSNAAGKEQTFKKIKDSLDFIMTYYGAERIRYAVITFGLSSYEDVSFQDGRTVDELRELVDRIPRASGVPDLKESLEKAKDVFDKSTDRPEAKKFLIVVMDSESSSGPDEVQQGAEALEKEGIKVINHVLQRNRLRLVMINLVDTGRYLDISRAWYNCSYYFHVPFGLNLVASSYIYIPTACAVKLVKILIMMKLR